jgi:hypothetical protein
MKKSISEVFPFKVCNTHLSGEVYDRKYSEHPLEDEGVNEL